MRVFLYEFVTGGGWWSITASDPPTGSLLREGKAMASAIAADFCRVPGVQVTTLVDARLELDESLPIERRKIASRTDERDAFHACVIGSDWTFVIAPETEGLLLERTGWAEQTGAELLSPSSEFVRLASNKQDTAERLHERGVRVPRGMLWSGRDSRPPLLPFPLVMKPNDGAGSVDVRYLANERELAAAVPRGSVRLEEFFPGKPASVSVLCGLNQIQVLPACRQELSDDGCFSYLGGETPLGPNECRRAELMARAVIAALPRTSGYIGIDLALGDAEDGSRDAVIEVNPRLTTSYVGLREIAHSNLAGALLEIVAGRAVALSFSKQIVRFDAAGVILQRGACGC